MKLLFYLFVIRKGVKGMEKQWKNNGQNKGDEYD